MYSSLITVDYIDHFGSDLKIANTARVSFNKESEWEIEIVDRESNRTNYPYSSK